MKWFDMEETPYRASQICRVLGNPKAYQILLHLKANGPSTPTEIAKAVNRHHSTVCIALKTLREVQLVRYTRAGVNALYRLKLDEVCEVLDRLEELVRRIRAQR
jgi:DNA-binding transcriptional ArsR family regulator